MPLGGSEPTSGSPAPETTSWVSGLGPGDGSAGADVERQWTGCRVRGSVSHLVGQSRAVVGRRRPRGGQACMHRCSSRRASPQFWAHRGRGSPELPPVSPGSQGMCLSPHEPCLDGPSCGPCLTPGGSESRGALPGASEMLATRPRAEQTECFLPVLLTTPASWSSLF